MLSDLVEWANKQVSKRKDKKTIEWERKNCNVELFNKLQELRRENIKFYVDLKRKLETLKLMKDKKVDVIIFVESLTEYNKKKPYRDAYEYPADYYNDEVSGYQELTDEEFDMIWDWWKDEK